MRLLLTLVLCFSFAISAADAAKTTEPAPAASKSATNAFLGVWTAVDARVVKGKEEFASEVQSFLKENAKSSPCMFTINEKCTATIQRPGEEGKTGKECVWVLTADIMTLYRENKVDVATLFLEGEKLIVSADNMEVIFAKKPAKP